MSDLQQLDETLDFLNEGKVLNKIKRVINNIINKNLKNNKNAPKKAVTKDLKPVTFTLKKATNEDFEKLYKTEALCAEGLANSDSEETAQYFANYISNWEGRADEIHFFWCKGKDLNTYYHLKGDNMYPNDLGIFFIDLSNFGKSFKASEHKGSFRWFSDVVDNNARREIIKGNKYYDNYHSLYGDDWFYSTIN